MLDIEKFEQFNDYVEVNIKSYSEKRALINTYKKIVVWERLTGLQVSKWDSDLVNQLFSKGLKIDDWNEYNLRKIKKENLSKYEETLKDLSFINIKNIEKAIKSSKSTSYYSERSNILQLNKVLKFLGSGVSVNISSSDVAESEKSKDTLYTKENIIDICNTIQNMQDRFIIYALFLGIMGSKYTDLTNVKVSDINWNNKTITLPSGKIVQYDEYFETILKEVTDETFGSLYYKIDKTGSNLSNQFYTFNMKSPYILKVKPTKTNGDGMNPMSYQGIQTRIKSLSTALDKDLKGGRLYKSGAAHKMNLLKRDKWMTKDIVEFLKDNQYDLNHQEVKLAYESLYVN